MSFNSKKNTSFDINIRGQILSYEKGIFNFKGVSLPTLNKKKVNVRILLDRTTIEIFADDGFSVLSEYSVSDSQNTQISVVSNKRIVFNKFEINKLNSIWP